MDCSSVTLTTLERNHAAAEQSPRTTAAHCKASVMIALNIVEAHPHHALTLGGSGTSMRITEGQPKDLPNFPERDG